MHEEVSTLRLYLMRAVYLMMFLFLASTKWPLLVHHQPWTQMVSVGFIMLAALGFMAGWALRYPLKMLPVLVYELVWKAMWVASVGYPLWRAGNMDPDMAETLKATFFGVILVAVILPWGYLWRNYVKAPSERWKPRPAA